MADFYGCLMATEFRVKDREAWLADPDVQELKSLAESEGFFGENSDGGYWSFGWHGQYPSPALTELDDEGNEKETNFLAAIQRHIRPGDVCQVGVSGNEKLRYIGGGIWFVTSEGIADFPGVTDWQERVSAGELLLEMERFFHAIKEIV